MWLLSTAVSSRRKDNHQDSRAAAKSFSRGREPTEIVIDIPAAQRRQRCLMTDIALSNSKTASTPKLPIEHAVVDCFAEVFFANVLAIIHIGDRAGYAQHFVVGTGRESQLLNAGFHEARARTTEFA